MTLLRIAKLDGMTSVMRLPKSADPQIWASFIAAKAESAVASIIDCGRALIAAKVELGVGDWGRMFAESDEPVAHPLPFSIRSAQMYVAVAGSMVLSNTNHGSLLPPSWRSLYELTKMPEDRLEEALASGDITPDMTREQVRRLVNPTTADRPVRQRAPDPVSDAELWEAAESKQRVVRSVLAELQRRGYPVRAQFNAADSLSGQIAALRHSPRLASA